FVHDNSNTAPAYSISATDGTTVVGPYPAAVSFTGSTSDSVSVFENRIGVLTVPSTGVVGTPGFAITGGADAGKFVVNPTSGLLAFQTVPDIEMPADADGNNIFEVVVTVTGATSGTDVRTIIVTLLNINEAPTIAGVPSANVVEGSAYSFIPAAADPENATLT